MQRLTDKTADYCRDKCGMAPTCKRLKEGDICQNARCYERLRRYEDTGLEPEEIAVRAGEEVSECTYSTATDTR